jgi:hypothetical protein
MGGETLALAGGGETGAVVTAGGGVVAVGGASGTGSRLQAAVKERHATKSKVGRRCAVEPVPCGEANESSSLSTMPGSLLLCDGAKAHTITADEHEFSVSDFFAQEIVTRRAVA